MPKTKFQDFVFTLIMVAVMVYAMVIYNIALDMGNLQNAAFLYAFGELPLMGGIGFLLEFFLYGKLAQKLAFRCVTPGKDAPILLIVLISAITVCLMCPTMSFFATIFFKETVPATFLSAWIELTVTNFPMALCWQLFAAGPLVRLIFRTLFRKQLAEETQQVA